MKEKYIQGMKQVNDQTYEVSYQDRLVTELPRGKKARIERLRNLIYLKLRERWQRIPKYQATLEKTAFNELLDNI